MIPGWRNQKNFLDQPVEVKQPRGEGDLTRQEQAPDADVNNILSRYGVGPVRPLTYGDVNYDMGLQDALNTVSRARRIWSELPEEIRKEYKSYRDLLQAIESGAVVLKDGNPPGPMTEEQELAAIEAQERKDTLREKERIRKLRELGALPPEQPKT